MVGQSGTTAYLLDARDRVTNKTVSWFGGPRNSLSYGLDRNGSVTDISSASSNGVNLHYDLDALNRVTNVLANTVFAAGYHFDLAGNVDSVE